MRASIGDRLCVHSRTVDRPEAPCPVPAEVPDRVVASHGATVVVTGHDPAERRAWLVHRSR